MHGLPNLKIMNDVVKINILTESLMDTLKTHQQHKKWSYKYHSEIK